MMGYQRYLGGKLKKRTNTFNDFVDVLNTMLDADLPLTPPEWKELGNPLENPDAYDLLLSYSPHDNIEARGYPPMFVSGGINDPRVTYWEPAKWTPKMRINMGSGHFSNSGCYSRLRDYAEAYTFALRSLGIND